MSDLVFRVPLAPESKPRKRPTKRALAEKIRSAVLALEGWRTETMGTSRVLMTTVGELEILRTTPAAKLEGMPAANGIDIWDRKRKVLSIWWNVEHELEVVAFKKGEWYQPLLTPTLPAV